MSDDATPAFGPDAVAAICRHMNDDHPDDCLRMVRGLGGVGATAVTMIGLDDHSAFFRATTDAGELEVALPWSRRLTERAQVRTEVVAMHERACRALGLEPSSGEGH